MTRSRSSLFGVLWMLALPTLVGSSCNGGGDNNVRLPTTVRAGEKLQGTVTYQNNTGQTLQLNQLNVVVARSGSVFGTARVNYGAKSLPAGQQMEIPIDVAISPQAQGDATVEIESNWIGAKGLRHDKVQGSVKITR